MPTCLVQLVAVILPTIKSPQQYQLLLSQEAWMKPWCFSTTESWTLLFSWPAKVSPIHCLCLTEWCVYVSLISKKKSCNKKSICTYSVIQITYIITITKAYNIQCFFISVLLSFLSNIGCFWNVFNHQMHLNKCCLVESIHHSLTAFAISGHECLTRYSNNPISDQIIFWFQAKIFSVSFTGLTVKTFGIPEVYNLHACNLLSRLLLWSLVQAWLF